MLKIKFKDKSIAMIHYARNPLTALKETEIEAEKSNLILSNIPMLVEGLTKIPDLKSYIRGSCTETVSSEFHGTRNGERVYEIWHSFGPFSSSDKLKNYEIMRNNAISDDCFIQLPDEIWNNFTDEKTNSEVPRIPLEEIDAINPSFDYTQPHIYFESADRFYDKAIEIINQRVDQKILDKLLTEIDNQNSPTAEKKPYINLEPANHLEYIFRIALKTLFEKDFTNSDRMLMLTGNEKNRISLAEILYGSRRNNNEQREIIYDTNNILTTSYQQNIGRSLCFDHASNGIHGRQYTDNGARFTALNLDLIREISEKNKNPSLVIEKTQYK
jgi:hypothetical protein